MPGAASAPEAHVSECFDGWKAPWTLVASTEQSWDCRGSFDEPHSRMRSASDMENVSLRRSFVIATSIALVMSAPTVAGTLSLKEIRESGVIIQQWDTSCAAAALATVLTYDFSDPVTERDVAGGLLRQTEPLKVRHRGGFSMLDMKRYAVERGYDAVGLRGMTFDDIRFLHAPIVPVSFHGYNHYVVFRGMTVDGAVKIADPAYGNRTLSRDRFEAAWIDGIAFVLRGNPQ